MKCNRKKPESCFNCPYAECIEKNYNPEKNKEYCKTYYQRHKEEIIRRVREYQKKNREKKLQYDREYNRAYRKAQKLIMKGEKNA